ncbi:MAG: hypothetical protein KAX19_01450 [Candidatus Brocadiae bacterium]|nr:hypothetical protein [Candidatus Brocadiia bacterium]
MSASDSMAVRTAPHNEQRQGRHLREVIKRDGLHVPFDKSKIADRVLKAASIPLGRGSIMAEILAEEIADAVVMFLDKHCDEGPLHVADILDVVETVLIETGHPKIAALVAPNGIGAARSQAACCHNCGGAHETERAHSGPDGDLT